MNKLYILLSLLLCFATSNCEAHEFTKETQKSCYKVKSILSQKNIYIIYAQRNDTLFKILSAKKILSDKTGYKKIRRGKCYTIDLKSLFPSEFLGQKLMPPGSTGRMTVNFEGIDISVEPKNNIWNIYETTNLKGLYIKENLR